MLTSTGGGGALVTAADVPGAGIDLDAVSGYAKTLATAGSGIETGGTDAAAAWSRLPTAYESTGTEALYSALVPVTEHGTAVNTALASAQKALDNYVSQARSVLAKVAQLRTDVATFASTTSSYPKPIPFALGYAPSASGPNALSAPKPTYDSWDEDPAAVAANDELAARARALSNDLLNLQSECASAIRRAAGLPAFGGEEGAEDALASRSRAAASGGQAAGAPEGGVGSLFRSIGDWFGDVFGGAANNYAAGTKAQQLSNAAQAQGWADAAKWWNDTAAPATAQWLGDRWAEFAAAQQSINNTMLHHPDEAFEVLGGLATILGGVGMEAGGVVADISIAGIPGGVALAVSGADVIAAGATSVGIGGAQILQHAESDERVDPSYPPRTRDPQGQNPNYPGRNNLGKFNGGKDTVSPATEKAGLDKADKSDLFDEPVLRDQVEAHFDGDKQIRKYDGLGKTGPDEYTGVEVKPPGEVLKNGDNANVDQRKFDAQVSEQHPAYATLTEKVNGKTVKIPIKITKVILIVVGQKK